MRSEQTATLTCRECGLEVDHFERGWKAFLSATDEEPEEEIVVLCPDCCEREQPGG